MICPRCGNQAKDGATFCDRCGVRFPTAGAPFQPAQPMSQPQNTPAQSPYTPPQTPYVPQQNQYVPPQPPYGQQQYPPIQYPPMMPKIPGKGTGITALVLGIVSIVFFWYWPISITCAVVGLILGYVSTNEAKNVGVRNSMAVAGMICSAISIGICLIYVLAVGSLVFYW